MSISRETNLGFRQSHAFVIGIDKYPFLSDLGNAVRDAISIACRLKVLQGFENVLLMTDVNKEAIDFLLRWFKKEIDWDTLSAEDKAIFTDTSKVSWLKLKTDLTPLENERIEDWPKVALDWSEEGISELYRVPFSPVEILNDSLENAPLLAEANKKRDSLLFYYAGHGFAGEINDGPVGYLGPSDTNMVDNLLPMHEVYTALSALNCTHSLLILDCCFAGKFRFTNNSRSGRLPVPVPLYERRFERYKASMAWQVLLSSGADQTAADSLPLIGTRSKSTHSPNSPFAKALMDALEGKADIPSSINHGRNQGDGIITATEIYYYVWDQVERETSGIKVQHPGLFPMKQHRAGEFIFVHPKGIDKKQFADNPLNNPYKGLKSYSTEKTDQELFFGRKRVVKEILKKLEQVSVLFITAASGAGKSSVIKAGVYPKLKAQLDRELIILRPSELIEHAPISTEATDANPPPSQFDILKTRLANDKPYLFLIDQYEEIFTLAETTDLQTKISQLLDVVTIAKQKAIFTLRSDFEWQIKKSKLKGYWETQRIYRLPPMDLDELRAAITGPAWWAMYDFKDDRTTKENDQGEALINLILEEVANAPGALPLLSFTMQAFYKMARDNFEEKRDKTRQLVLADYQKVLKGVDGALSTIASKVYEQFSDAEKKIMQKLFIRMVNLYDNSFTRRRVFYTEIAAVAAEVNNLSLYELDFPKNHDLVKGVIDKLEEAFLVVQDKDKDGNNFVEPAHDSLINHWDTGRAWLD